MYTVEKYRKHFTSINITSLIVNIIYIVVL